MQQLQSSGLGGPGAGLGGGGMPAGMGMGGGMGGMDPFAAMMGGGMGMGGGAGVGAGAGVGGAGGAPAGAGAASTEPPETVYASQLQQLKDMGFFDEAQNIRALQATMGNVSAAIERLLQ